MSAGLISRGTSAAMDGESTYDQLYLQGITLFNACDFHEAHDAWEEIWTEYRGPSREFYKGLIQAAVALHHFGNGNIRGARKVFGTSRNYLEKYRPAHMGLDLETFLPALDRCFAEVVATEEEYPQLELDAELIPEIHLDPPVPGA